MAISSPLRWVEIHPHIIGDDCNCFAHADLYIADSSPEQVFAPITRWLDELPRR